MNILSFGTRLVPCHQSFKKFTGQTGRPVSDNPVNNVMIAILNKNSDTGYSAFKQDMKLIFDRFSDEELASYYQVYIAGAECIANKMKRAFKV